MKKERGQKLKVKDYFCKVDISIINIKMKQKNGKIVAKTTGEYSNILLY